MGDFGDLEYFYRGFEHGVITERHRIIALLLEDCTCDYDRGELANECKIHELVRIIQEHSDD